MASKKKCVICEVEPGVGALARAYALGVQQGYREADTPPVKEPSETHPMCATHQRQVQEADMALLAVIARKGAEAIRKESAR